MPCDPLESTIEGKAVAFAKSRGWWEAKIMRANKRGIPDRLFIRWGRVVFIEFKREGEVASMQQQLRMAELIAQGVEAYCFDSYDAAIAILA